MSVHTNNGRVDKENYYEIPVGAIIYYKRDGDPKVEEIEKLKILAKLDKTTAPFDTIEKIMLNGKCIMPELYGKVFSWDWVNQIV